MNIFLDGARASSGAAMETHGTLPVGIIRSMAKWLTQFASTMIVAGLLSGAAVAQSFMFVSNATVFEGNAGTKVMQFPVGFIGAQPNVVTGFVSAIPGSGTGFNPATGGAACGAGGVDFVSFTPQAFTIPANTPNGTLYVGVTICGDATIEADQHIFVLLTGLSGAICGDVCAAIGTIVNDDGPPSMSINSISVSEPAFGTKTATFTVTLHHPSTQEVRAHFATRDGTAKGRCLNCFAYDYEPNSGTLIIPAGAPSGSIAVTIVADGSTEPNETFFVDLSAPVNGTIAGGTGTATIRDTTLSLGGFEVSPDDATVGVGETVPFYVDWTVPEGRVWRNLRSIDFRIRGGNTAIWARWEEASNLISLCRKGTKDGTDDDDGPGPDAVCTPGGLPGSGDILQTDRARILLAESSVVGSGPTGRDVTLVLAVVFLDKAEGHSYKIEVAAADDFGGEDRFVRAADVRVEKSKGH